MTPEDAAVTAKVYEILSRGKKYQWRPNPGNYPWSAPFGIETTEGIDNNGATECGTYRAGIEVREAPAEPRRFAIGLNGRGEPLCVLVHRHPNDQACWVNSSVVETVYVVEEKGTY